MELQLEDQECILIQVSDIVFAVSSDWPVRSIRFGESYRDFFCGRVPEVTIRARYGELPELNLRDEDKAFDSEMVWSLYRTDGQHVIALRSPTSGPVPYRVALFDGEFRRGEVYSRLPEADWSPDEPLPGPLDYPLAEVLMVCLLARGRGLMVHACGIDDGGRGLLFAGNSTHGKSTMARQWANEAIILNDDRIVLRQRAGRFWMYGTPWHGDYTGVSPQGVPLDKVFFLRHGDDNHARQVAGAEAASMLLARCFPPLWDESGMRFTLGFIAQLAEAVPCYELDFVPDERIVEYVRCVP
jgi:hypothetical protein